MKLRELLPVDVHLDSQFADREVSGVSADTRTIKPGNLFVALTGSRTDGARYVQDAIQAGAVAVVSEQPLEGLPAAVAQARAPNARRALSLMAARVYLRQPATIAAVTGTSGKTSVVSFTRQIWQALNHSAASMGTIGVVAPGIETYGSLTTPDPIALHRDVDNLAERGVTHLAIEASSHGLHQHRLDGLRLRVGAYLNLSRDHLDYHPTLESYFAAKLRLFSELLPPDATAVINLDDAHGAEVARVTSGRGVRALTIGRGEATLAIENIQRDGFGQRVRVRYGGRPTEIALPLVGGFQVENALVAAGIAIAGGDEPERIFPLLNSLQGAKGRLEHVGTYRGAPIFVDYAHKPDALAKTLEALRPYAQRRLALVFGCGGDRDQGKRPIMGQIAAANADCVIVTDDNPRTENPAAIRSAILACAPGATEIPDRAEAIRVAIAGLEPGDVLVIAGKGHESGQIVGDRVLPFTDHAAVAAALGEQAA
jgi:UDP-N-acetylmuramoyl-L-alanyl-D-glutamate--2,6-diaminopimelate ligase